MSAIYKNGTWYGKTSDSASLPSGGTTGQALVKASNTDGDVEWGSVNSEGVIYSTTERVIGRWIDGKPIYEKTINFGALPNTTSKTVAHNISNLNEVIGYIGISNNNVNYVIMPYTSDINPIQLYIDNSNITIVCIKDNSMYTKTYITIRYTKTTDA